MLAIAGNKLSRQEMNEKSAGLKFFFRTGTLFIERYFRVSLHYRDFELSQNLQQ